MNGTTSTSTLNLDSQDRQMGNVTGQPAAFVVLFAPNESPSNSQTILLILEIFICVFTLGVSSVFGIVANILNIIVYSRHGLNESIVLGFFALSISDLIVAACPLFAVACFLLDIFHPDIPVHFMGLYTVCVANLMEMAFLYSNTLTMFLSIERCCCVILPFHVKAIFTLNRSRTVILALLLLVIMGCVPTYAAYELRWVPVPISNGTMNVLIVWFQPYRKEIRYVSVYAMGIAIPTVALLVVFINTAIMTHGLRASSEFRKTAAAGVSEKSKTNHETRLVKVMVFLGVILTACNLPFLVLFYIMLFEPRFDLGNDFNDSVRRFYGVTYLLSTVNGSANIFVYYKNSSRYRQIFDKSFGCLRITRTIR